MSPHTGSWAQDLVCEAADAEILAVARGLLSMML